MHKLKGINYNHNALRHTLSELQKRDTFGLCCYTVITKSPVLQQLLLAVLLPARARPRLPPGGQVVQAVAGVAVTRRAHVTAATPVLDAAHGKPETRARAQLAPERMLVRILYGGAVTPE